VLSLPVEPLILFEKMKLVIRCVSIHARCDMMMTYVLKQALFSL
jgi:hypothetical protein